MRMAGVDARAICKYTATIMVEWIEESSKFDGTKDDEIMKLLKVKMR
jgi:hypothetical protein